MAKKKPRRPYPDAERAAALAAYRANNGNLAKTARDTGVARKTLAGWVTAAHNPPPAALVAEAERTLADLCEAAVRRVLAHPYDLALVPFREAVVAAGVLVDKLLLLRGQPTAITQALPADAPDLTKLTDDELAAYIAAQRALAGRPAPPPAG